MPLQQLIDDFAPDGDGITRITSAKPAGAGPLLARLGLGDGPLEFTQPQTITGSTTVTLVGNVSWRTSSGRASIVGSELAGGGYRLVFQLDIRSPSPWTFGSAFPVLPGMWRAEAAGLTESPSYLLTLRLDQPSVLADNTPLQPGLALARLRGWLPMTGDLAAYAGYLGPAPLGLDGTFTLDAEGNGHLVLEALADHAPSAVPGLAGTALSGIGLRLTTEMPDDLATEPDATMSALLLVAHVPFNNSPVEITAPLLWGEFVWPLFANLRWVVPQLTLTNGLASVGQLFGLPAGDFELPPGIDLLNQFYLAELGVGLEPPSAGGLLPSVQYLSATISSDHRWAPPVPYLHIDKVSSNWVFYFYDTAEPSLGATVGGDLVLGGGQKAARTWELYGPPDAFPLATVPDPATSIRFRVRVFYPDWEIEGQLLNEDGDSTVPLLDVFRAFNFDGSGGPLDQGLKLNEVMFRASIPQQTFNLSGSLTTTWSIPVGNVTFLLSEVWMWVNVSQSGITGGMTGIFYAVAPGPGGEQTPGFLLSASYLGDGRWKFSGEMIGQLELVTFLSAIAGLAPPAWVQGLNVTLTRLALGFDSGDNTYRAEGAAVAKWVINALGISQLALTAEAEVEKTAAWPTPQGKLKGSFAINKISVMAGVELTRDQMTYMFGIRFDQLELVASTAWSNEGGTNHQILNVQMRGMTLGGILEYLVRLAAPASDFSLEAPWNLLNSIDLSNFLLTLDRVNNTVTLSYKVDANLGFMYLNTVGVRYTYSGKGRVNLVLTGRILDREYGGDSGNAPLGWDVVNDPPPALPGKGPRLIDLRYLGMGQHVTLTNMGDFTTVQQAIAALRDEMKAADDPQKNPVGQGNLPQLVFSDLSQWMVGLDITVMDTVSVALVLHDPDLYGLLISLGGPEAGGLSGFSFELLYRKVTDDIGVFRVQVKVPDMFRQIELGTVSVTLGIITVEIYTNGNFMVDLGFPHNRDYSVSFAVQVLPFIGRGGIYFARLTGATSRRVPVITNGNFEPVLELGVGLAVGLGKEFNKGPLSAGLYVELEVIIEGVLAWFHPTDSAQPAARYHWVQGLAGISGKLYGKVDFKIIRVSVSVSLHAYAMVTLESYQATLVELEVGVEASAEVTILFISISFSFSITIHESFVLGSSSTPPWILAADQSRRTPDTHLGHMLPPRRRSYLQVVGHTRNAYLALLRQSHPARYGQLMAGMLDSSCDNYILTWDKTAKVFPDQLAHPVILRVMLLPAVDKVTAAFSPSQPPSNPNPDYRASVVLSVDNGNNLPPADNSDAPRRPSVALSAHADDVADLSFNVLVEAFLRWALLALPDHGQWPNLAVAGQVDLLAEQMACPQTSSTGFGWEALSGFIDSNLQLRVCMPPAGAVAATTFGGSLFPIPPMVKWDASISDRSRNFWLFSQVDQAYETELSRYFDTLDPLPARNGNGAGAADEGFESAATFVFRDAMLILAKTAVEEAQTLLRAWPYASQGGESLQDIADWFSQVSVQYLKHAGDTVDQVAAFYGMSASELVALNPNIVGTLASTAANQALPVTLGVTAESLAVANANVALSAATLNLGDVPTQVRVAAPSLLVPPPVAETLAMLAGRFGKVPADIAQGDTLTSAKLLRPGAGVDVSTMIFANPDNLTLATATAVLFARLYGIGAVDATSYQIHSQLIADNNANLVGIDIDALLVVGSLVNLSGTLGDTWTVQVGDSLARIAAATALVREGASQSAVYAGFVAAVLQANAGRTDGQVSLPAGQLTALEPGESLAGLADRLLYPTTGLVITLTATTDMLQPLAALVIPAVRVAVSNADTLDALNKTYNLPLEAMGHVLAAQPGLFNGAPVLTVPHVPAVTIDKLVATLQSSQASLHISGMVSRFLLHGLRPPVPNDANNQLEALYDLVGQQLVPDTTTPITLTFGTALAANWIGYYLTAVSLVETLPDFATRNAVPLAQVQTLNPAAAARYGIDTPMPGGLVLMTQPAGSQSVPAVLTLDHSQLAYPDPTLQLPTVRAPHAMKLARLVPVTYGLQQHITWQAGANPWSTGAQSGTPSLWPFPAQLESQAARPPAYDYALVSNALQPGAATPPSITHYAWGTLLDIAIRRSSMTLPDGKVKTQSNVYEVIGADTAGRQTLLELWQALPSSGGADIYLLYVPPAQSDRPNGLASVPLSNALTFILKSNLSTETASGRSLRTDALALPIQGANFAQIDTPKSFLTLLWECSVVGGGGYTLGYAANDGAGFPEQLFDGTGNGSISLLVVPNPALRRLQPYFNCAVVGDNVDASSVNLVVRAVADQELVPQPAVTPGNIGFDFAISNPDLLPAQTATQKLARQAYSLAGYQLLQTDAFSGSDTAMPVGPQVSDPELVPNGQIAPHDETTWFYHRVVPINRFATKWFAPNQAMLPPPNNDPYAGIAALWSATAPTPATTSINLWFQDLLGNVTAESGAASAVAALPDVMVGYTDALQGPGQWPNIAAGYSVSAAGALAQLNVSFGLQLTAYLPGPGDAPQAMVDAAAKHGDAYAAIHYQLAQPDVSSVLTTNLAMARDAHGQPQLTPLGGALYRLRALAAGAYIFLRQIAGGPGQPGLQQVLAEPGVGQSFNFANILADYGFTTDSGDSDSGYQLLARANAHQPLTLLLWGANPPQGAAISVPRFHVFRDGESFMSIFTVQANAIQMLSQTQNAHLPLRAGQPLQVPPRTKDVPTPDTAWLGLVAEKLYCAPSDLALTNKDTTGLLRLGFSFSYLDMTAQVGLEPGPNPQKTVSLQMIADAFTSRGHPVSAVDLAVLNQYDPGMFADGTQVLINRYQVQANDRLAVNLAALAITDLVNLNFETPDLFDAGVPLYLSAQPNVSVPVGQSLEQFTQAWGITSTQLLQALATSQTLAAQAEVLIPGAASWSGSEGVTPFAAPYALRQADTLTSISDAFSVIGAAVTARQLAAANAELPGVLAAQKITVGVKFVTPVAGSSFNDVVADFAAQQVTVTVDQIADAIAGSGGYLQAGGLLVCPLTRLGDGASGLSLAAIQTAFGVAPADFSVANAALPNLLLPGVLVSVQVSDPKGGPPTTVSTLTRSNDTFNSLIARFAAEGTSVSVAMLAQFNPALALINPAQRPVLPPVAAALSATFGAGSDGNWVFAEPLFDLSVNLTLKRENVLVDPAFQPAAGQPPTPVEQSVTLIAPIALLAEGQALAIGRPMTLTQFALDLERAIPPLRLASGKVLQGGVPSNDVWAVVFGSGGIRSLTVAPTFDIGQGVKSPWFFALRPLSTDLIMASDLLIKSLKDGQLEDPGKLTAISGVDLEIWARRFLADYDRMLSAGWASGLYRLAVQEVRSRIDELIDNKTKLAEGIANGLDFVLESSTLLQARLASAQAQLKQRLLASLSAGYSVDVMLQWDATVQSDWQQAVVKLVGTPRQTDSADDNLSLGSSKVTLADSSSTAADPYFNVTLKVNNGANISPRHLAVDFVPGEIEFGISPVSGVTGYVSSNWLRFVHPLSDTPPAGYSVNLGAADVPIPLRAYPALPQLVGHMAPANSAVPPATVAAATSWKYVTSVAHGAVLQDEINYEIEFNLPPVDNQLFADARRPLIAALAQYSAVADELWSVLDTLPETKATDPPDTTLVNAIGTFIDLAGQVARAWQGYWAPAAVPHPSRQLGDGPQYQAFSLTSRLYSQDGLTLSSIRFTALNSLPGPGGWPDLDIITPGGHTVKTTGQTLPSGEREYVPEEVILFAGALTQVLTYPALAAGNYQNAQTTNSVVRNAHLMLNNTPATRSGFVYRTPSLTFSDRAIPLLDWSTRIPISTFSKQDPSPLVAMFQDLFSGNGAGMQVSLAVSYNFRLTQDTDGQEPLITSLPVLLLPRSLYQSTLAQQLADALDTWRTNNSPSTLNGEWQIALSLFSAIEPALERPIVILGRVVSPLVMP